MNGHQEKKFDPKREEYTHSINCSIHFSSSLIFCTMFKTMLALFVCIRINNIRLIFSLGCGLIIM
ncbi:hypothetical protein DERP_002002 [Dermatophagoides pteronyssinus]|uniref:Uncharacterized protein n=1 Tax=Dermatophagoides pteronyssinus TaxID=6956 RepID=A0ABQ8JGH4_DERPT|nr:hypothetical protein DERP_002002 [Dermatophagoides pteronyssinus]